MNIFENKDGVFKPQRTTIITGIFIFMVMVMTGTFGCEKSSNIPNQDQTFIETSERNRPIDLYDWDWNEGEKALTLLDTNIADYYDGFGQYYPYIIYSSPQDPLTLSNMIFGGKPNGQLRGAMDTISGQKYYAYWYDTPYQDRNYSVIIFTKIGNENLNWIYVIDNGLIGQSVTITGETLIQTLTTNNIQGYGNFKVFGNPNIGNIGTWDINPFKDTQNRLYSGALWTLECEAIHNLGDTLRFKRYCFIRIGEGSSQSVFTGTGYLQSYPPDVTQIFQESVLEAEPVTINYQGVNTSFTLLNSDMQGYEIGNTTNISSLFCQGINNGQLVNLPISQFTKITFKSNGGAGVISNPY